MEGKELRPASVVVFLVIRRDRLGVERAIQAMNLESRQHKEGSEEKGMTV